MCSVKIFDYKINADLNKNVFNLDLKIAKEGLSRISKGKFIAILLCYISQITPIFFLIDVEIKKHKKETAPSNSNDN